MSAVAWVLTACGIGAASGLTLLALTNTARAGDQQDDTRAAAIASGLIRGDDQP